MPGIPQDGRFREPAKQNKTRQIQSCGRVMIQSAFGPCFVLFCFGKTKEGGQSQKRRWKSLRMGARNQAKTHVFFTKKQQKKTKRGPPCPQNPYPTVPPESAVFCFVLLARENDHLGGFRAWIPERSDFFKGPKGSLAPLGPERSDFLRGPKAPRAPWARSEATLLRGPKAPSQINLGSSG